MAYLVESIICPFCHHTHPHDNIKEHAIAAEYLCEKCKRIFYYEKYKLVRFTTMKQPSHDKEYKKIKIVKPDTAKKSVVVESGGAPPSPPSKML